MAFILVSVLGVSAPVSAATTPTTYAGTAVGGRKIIAIQNFTITQFNGRGIFFGTIKTGGTTYKGYGRYVGTTLLFSWFTYDALGNATYIGDFSGTFGVGYLTLVGTINIGTQKGTFSMKAA